MDAMNLSKLWKIVEDREAWHVAVHGVTKNQTQLRNLTTTYVHGYVLLAESLSVCNGLRMFLEKAMAPHSSTLAWKIPWMEEPGRLQSMGSLRVGHD